MPVTEYYNIDIANNRLLILDNLFIDRSYQERLKAYLTDAIKERWPMYKDDYYKDKILESGISNTAKFFILNGGLNIAFAKYEVAWGTVGEPEFSIPTEVIEDILKPEYKEIIK